jgi:hypothetical protein
MMKKHNIKRYALIGVVILIGLLAAYILVPRGKPIVLAKTDALFGLVADGDIICRLGDRLWSQFIKDASVDDKRYSHIGIIRVSGGQVTVIHAEGTTKLAKDYVKEVPLDEFLEIARAVGIYRIKDIDGRLVSSTAMQFLGVPFDWQLDIGDSSKIYCTELLYVVLKRIAPELELGTTYMKEVGKDIIPLEAISNSEHFEEIYFATNGG